tara:strand:+ start:311 stop:2242 length:1932 start_codon:yes stop_codon:yes gene_type:complete
MKDVEERQEKKETDDEEYGTFDAGADIDDPDYDEALDQYRKYYKGEDIKPMMKAYFDNNGFGWDGVAPNEILGHNDYKKALIDITKHTKDNIDEEFNYHYFDGEWVEITTEESIKPIVWVIENTQNSINRFASSKLPEDRNGLDEMIKTMRDGEMTGGFWIVEWNKEREKDDTYNHFHLAWSDYDAEDDDVIRFLAGGGRRRKKKTRKKRGGMDSQPPTPEWRPGQPPLTPPENLPDYILPPPANTITRRTDRSEEKRAPPDMSLPEDVRAMLVNRANERYRRSQRSYLRNLSGDLLKRCTGSRCGLGGGRRKKKTRKKRGGVIVDGVDIALNPFDKNNFNQDVIGEYFRFTTRSNTGVIQEFDGMRFLGHTHDGKARFKITGGQLNVRLEQFVEIWKYKADTDAEKYILEFNFGSPQQAGRRKKKTRKKRGGAPKFLCGPDIDFVPEVHFNELESIFNKLKEDTTDNALKEIVDELPLIRRDKKSGKCIGCKKLIDELVKNTMPSFVGPKILPIENDKILWLQQFTGVHKGGMCAVMGGKRRKKKRRKKRGGMEALRKRINKSAKKIDKNRQNLSNPEIRTSPITLPFVRPLTKSQSNFEDTINRSISPIVSKDSRAGKRSNKKTRKKKYKKRSTKKKSRKR